MTTNAATQRFLLVFYVPASHAAACKDAIFKAGAGGFLKYSEWCFTTTGTGQFRPGNAANPYIGTPGVKEMVPEEKVEASCIGNEVMQNVVNALKEAHPYEEVAYFVFKAENF